MKKSDIKLHQLVFVLSMVAALAVAIGGYLHYSTVKKHAIEREYRQVSEHLKDMRDYIDSYLTWSLASVKALAGLKELQQPLVSGDSVALARANTILDHFRDAMQASVCYLMDRSGNTIASSNRNTPVSFVGKNYGFRPYFQQAMQGFPTIYMALGVTSKKRGIYFSHPVYGKGKEGPLGVAIIKASVEMIPKGSMKSHDGIVLLTDPHGVVFVSDRSEWLYHVLWKVSSEEISEIAKTRQFGKGPWDWTGMKRVGKDRAVDNLGNDYHVHREELANYPGWHLVSLHDHHLVSKRVTESLLGTVGFSTLALCVLIGLFVFFLYKKTSSEIFQRERAEEALRENEEKYRTLIENAGEAIIVAQDGVIKFANPKGEELYGRSQEELASRPLTHFIYEEDREMVGERHKRWLKGEEPPMAYSFRIVDKNGDIKWVELSVVLFSWDDRLATLCFMKDITERKQAEEQVKASLKEKEVLLSEIHHRVKNNMQVIISLLRLRADKIEDKKYADMFKEGEDRIRSMALVHEQLYQTKDFANIDFGEYVKSLAKGLFISHGVDTNKIKLNIEIKAVSLDIENAIPCGLIINELVSNSLKYAFPQGKEGKISISLRLINGDEFELSVSDDGVGIPEDLDIRNMESMGLDLVTLLAEDQFDGKIDLNRTGGTRYHIRFKMQKYKARM